MRSKEQKRGRRKLDKARRHRSHRKAGAAAIGAAAAIAAGTQAYASPVRFDNPPGPGHFDWYHETTATFSVCDLNVVLDAALQPPCGDSQAVPIGPTTLRHVVDPIYPISWLQGQPTATGLQTQAIGNIAVGVDAGTLIPSGPAFRVGPWVDGTLYGYPPLLPEGLATHLGTRMTLPDGLHYGWIEVVRTGDALDALAWGYETEPGVPIAAGVPEPGSLALLAFGAAGLASRRRRRHA